MKGFISVHRKLMENPIWSDPNYLKLWMYCLFQASHKEHLQKLGNQMVTVKRGQFITGRFSLTEELNKGVKPKQKLNDKTWWRYLNNLESWGMLTIKTTNKYSVVTIDKYDFYQTKGNDYDHQTVHQMSNKSPSNVHQMSTNNNGNNGNKEKTLVEIPSAENGDPKIVDTEVHNKNSSIPYKKIIDHLNKKADKSFSSKTQKTKDLIKARWNEDHTLEDFIVVIDYFCAEWKGKQFTNGKSGDLYLRPTTLFNNKFDERLDAARLNQSKAKKNLETEYKSNSVDSEGHFSFY